MKPTAFFAMVSLLSPAALGVSVDCNTSALAPAGGTPEFSYAMGNLSSLFGWTLAGTASSQENLVDACDDISSFGYGKWAAAGFNASAIREPICNQSASGPNASLALPWELYYSTEVFTTHMLHAFAENDTEAFGYVCNNTRFLALNGFHLSDGRVVNATCSAADLQQPPRPQQAVAGVALVTNATVKYTNTASVLYAYLYASSATTQSMLNSYCAELPGQEKSLDAMFLNGTLVTETVCGIKQPMTTNEAIASLRKWASEMFIIVAENMSNAHGWLPFLAEKLDIDALDGVGLNGTQIITQVKADNATAVVSKA